LSASGLLGTALVEAHYRDFSPPVNIFFQIF